MDPIPLLVLNMSQPLPHQVPAGGTAAAPAVPKLALGALCEGPALTQWLDGWLVGSMMVKR